MLPTEPSQEEGEFYRPNTPGESPGLKSRRQQNQNQNQVQTDGTGAAAAVPGGDPATEGHRTEPATLDGEAEEPNGLQSRSCGEFQSGGRGTEPGTTKRIHTDEERRRTAEPD